MSDKSGTPAVGRETDVIVRGGCIIFPIEIERVLRSHSLVRDAAAFGAPDPELGQRVAAVVKLDGEGDDAAIDHILAAISGQLPDHKMPELLVAVDAVPRNARGEIDRQALVEAVFGISAYRNLQ